MTMVVLIDRVNSGSLQCHWNWNLRLVNLTEKSAWSAIIEGNLSNCTYTGILMSKRIDFVLSFARSCLIAYGIIDRLYFFS